MSKFKTLYYNARCKIYIKSAKTYKTLNRKRLKLDYEENKKLIQEIEILSLFEDEINQICLKYNTTKENLVIKESYFQQIENMDYFIQFTIKENKLIVHTLEEETYSVKTEYLIEVINNAIKIIIQNYDPKYVYQFKCNDFVGNFDYDSYIYAHNENTFTFQILTFYQDILINTVTKELKLNENIDVIFNQNNKKEKNNVHTNSLNLFQNGLEDIDNKPFLTNSSLNETFDIHANIKGLTQSTVQIYPKITTSYDINCTYDYLVDKVFGKFSYSATMDYDGLLKCKLIKLAVDPIKVTYNIACKVTFFETQSNGFKTWVTKDVVLSKEHTFDLYDDFFITDTINYNDNSLIKTPDTTPVYNLMNDKAKSLYSLGSNYTLHSYSIKDIKCYINGTLLSDSSKQYITPAFYSSSNVDMSKPIKYIVTPNFVYSDEKTIETVVGKNTVTIVNDASFDFNISNHSGDIYTGSRYKYKIYILDTSSYIEYNINGKVLTAWSTKTSSSSKSFEFNDNFSSITLNLKDEMKVPASFDTTATARIRITCLDESIYIGGTKYSKGQYKDITLTGKPENMFIGATGTVKKVTYTETIRLPENKDEVFRASLNGNEVTYMTAIKGKEDYIQKEEPFIIQPNATNIRYSINTFSTIPKSAIITKTITPTTNQLTHSMILKLSSDYTESIAVSNYTMLDTQTFNSFILVDGYIKEFDLSIKKPTVTKPNYQLYLESTNPNILLEYDKNLTFTSDTKVVKVKCYATKHPACKWNIMIPSSYCYFGEDEYFMYNKKIIATPTQDNKIFVGKKIETTNPICIMNNTSTLSRIISTEDDGITIKETLYSYDNHFFTTYKNINIKKVLDENNESIEFTKYNHYFFADANVCTVYYTVSDSFDYKVNETGTEITINTSHNGTVDLYYNTNDFLLSDVSLNPLHTNLDQGCVYISDKNEPAVTHKIYKSNYEDVYTYNIELLDKYNNPISSISNPIVSSLGANTSIIFLTKSSSNGILTLKLKSDTDVRTEKITINNYEIKL